MPDFNPSTAMPILVPAAYGLLLLVFAPLLKRDHGWLCAFGVGGMAVSLAVPLMKLLQPGADVPAVTGGLGGLPMIRTDLLSLWLCCLFAITGALTMLLLPSYMEQARARRAEVYALVSLAVAGMATMVSSDNLVMIFLGLEVLSIPLYILTGITRDDGRSIEAALKYFLLGALATGVLVYGMALVLGATGRLDLPGIASAIAATGGGFSESMLLAGLALIVVAFAFKIAVVPFHFWAPDVYQGAPTPITAFMAVGTKAAAFGVLVRVLHIGFAEAGIEARWSHALGIVALATMIAGNLLALVQVRVKRLLAYSSIAHAGYLLLALIAPLEIGVGNLLFYLVVYAFMTLGAFGVVTLLQDEHGDADHFADIAGLWHRHPWVAVAMAGFMLSLIGIPPFGGFTGKYVIFVAALEAERYLLATVMALTAVVGAAYYLRVIVAMFIEEPEGDLLERVRVPAPVAVALGIALGATLLLGLLPSRVLEPLRLVAATLSP